MHKTGKLEKQPRPNKGCRLNNNNTCAIAVGSETRVLVNLHQKTEPPTSSCCMFYPDFLIGLIINPEDIGDMFHRTVAILSTVYVALHPRR